MLATHSNFSIPEFQLFSFCPCLSGFGAFSLSLNSPNG